MNADMFRYYFDYHFALNRHMWDEYILTLTDEQFVQDTDYSTGSVRNHIVHLINVDEVWFCEMSGTEMDWRDAAEFTDRDKIRAEWDAVEQFIRGYLATLSNETLLQKPWTDEKEKDLMIWQALLHIINHGTDHRAQIRRLLHDLGVQTTAQDFVFFAYERPWTEGES